MYQPSEICRLRMIAIDLYTLSVRYLPKEGRDVVQYPINGTEEYRDGRLFILDTPFMDPNRFSLWSAQHLRGWLTAFRAVYPGAWLADFHAENEVRELVRGYLKWLKEYLSVPST